MRRFVPPNQAFIVSQAAAACNDFEQQQNQFHSQKHVIYNAHFLSNYF